MVTVNYFAAAARAMGTKQSQVQMATPQPLGEFVAGLSADAEQERVLSLCSWLVNSQRAEQNTQVDVDAVVEALPPFAGG